eukprot:TRINITY_DN14595_c0_g3_i1.p1 TRINITY_DN14595_c0_g3~~TRINITY_DN14595_c0_g3_i1.p1  ORF type:complete len:501 (+),score=80.45 TRINITY_DN14595_c0_g3_i1:77-1579(+)
MSRCDPEFQPAREAPSGMVISSPVEKVKGAVPSFRLTFFLIGVASLVSCLFHVYLFRKFTPVYTATTCGNETAVLNDIELGSDIHVELEISVTCFNPNPYSIEILASTPGQVWASSIRVGDLSVVPGSTLQEYGKGVIRVKMNSDLTGGSATSLLPHFVTDSQVPIKMELQFRVGVSVSFGLTSWGAAMPFAKKCGLNVVGILRTRIGPLVCRESFEDLVIPDVDANADAFADMSFSANQVAPVEVAEGTMAKDISLITMISLTFTCGVISIYVSFFWPTRLLAFLEDRRSKLADWRKSRWEAAETWIASMHARGAAKPEPAPKDELVALFKEGTGDLHNDMPVDGLGRTSDLHQEQAPGDIESPQRAPVPTNNEDSSGRGAGMTRAAGFFADDVDRPLLEGGSERHRADSLSARNADEEEHAALRSISITGDETLLVGGVDLPPPSPPPPPPPPLPPRRRSRGESSDNPLAEASPPNEEKAEADAAANTAPTGAVADML